MSILLLTQPQSPGLVAEHLRRLTPHECVAIDAAAVNPAQVECVVAYRLAAGVLPRFPNLALLCAASSGVEKLLAVPDLPAGLPVLRVVDHDQARQIAQYVVGHAIAHVRDFTLYAQQHEAQLWRRKPPPLWGSSPVTVLGLGHTGSAIARMLAQTGFKVRGWSRTARTLDSVECLHGEAALAQVLSSAQVVVNTLPVTETTRGLIDAKALTQLRADALLINVGRGESIDDTALHAHLRSGQMGGAVLDVHPQEPLPPDAAAWTVPQLLVTPHIASQPSALAVARTVVEGLRRHRAGLTHENLVDRTRGY